MFGAIPLVGTIIEGVSGFLKRKQDIKKNKVVAEAKLKLKKETGDQAITLTDAEWESLAVKGLADSWKDEYVTIIITAPIVGVLAGAVWNAFTGNNLLLLGTLDGITKLTLLGLNWDVLTTSVVLAAIGLKVWRNK